MEINLENLPHITNPIYYPLYKDKERYLVLYGGAGSGKSVFVGQKIILRMLSERNHKFLVVRKVAKTLRESTFSLLRGIVSDWGMTSLFDVNKTDMTITCKLNGNKIMHAGLDDVEKMKSVHGITGIWVEEASEIEQQDFQQLDLRLRGHTTNYKQIMISFNPISSLHWLKTVFFDSHKENTTVSHSTYLNNIFIDDAYRQVLEDMKDQDEYYYMVYALGEWGIVGKTIFNARKVNERISALRNMSFKRGQFTFEYHKENPNKILDETIQWVDDNQGYINIYEDKKNRFPYVIGGDTAGDGSDSFTAHVLDNITGKQVASLMHQFDEDMYAEQIYCLGKYFNNALIGLEVNFSTYPVKRLEQLGYKRMYYRETEDSYTHKVQQKYGFRTDRVTRPLIIANLVKIVREESHLINDIPTLNEMLTFVRNEKGKPEAQEGKHDDNIIGLAIAHYIRGQQEMELAQEIIEKAPVHFAFRTEDDEERGYVSW
jgi:phage terminase large subunit